MLDREKRKAAVEEFKKKPVRRGIYAIRNTATGEQWIGSTPNLDAAHNREWFALRQGLHENKALQREWNAAGQEAFTYVVLEVLDPELADMLIHDTLRDRRKHWLAETGSKPVPGF